MAETFEYRLVVKDDGSAVIQQFGKNAKDAGTQAAAAGEGASLGFAKFAKTFGAVTVVLNQGLELLGKFAGVMTGAIALASKFADEAAAQERAIVKLNAALVSTNHAAGLTSEQLLKLADSMAQTTLFADDVVISAEAILLTFRNISGEVFPRTIRVAADLATIMEMDLPSAARVLGKALDDPAEGLAALTRLGVRFSDEQKKVIESLVETGRSAEAANIVLTELEKRFGGQAAAQVNTYAGSVVMLQKSYGELQESIGFLIVNSQDLQAFLKTLTQVIDDMRMKVDQSGLSLDRLGVNGGNTFQILLDAARPVAIIFIRIAEAIQNIYNVARIAFNAIIKLLAKFIEFSLMPIFGILQGIVDQAIRFVEIGKTLAATFHLPTEQFDQAATILNSMNSEMASFMDTIKAAGKSAGDAITDAGADIIDTNRRTQEQIQLINDVYNNFTATLERNTQAQRENAAASASRSDIHSNFRSSFSGMQGAGFDPAATGISGGAIIPTGPMGPFPAATGIIQSGPMGPFPMPGDGLSATGIAESSTQTADIVVENFDRVNEKAAEYTDTISSAAEVTEEKFTIMSDVITSAASAITGALIDQAIAGKFSAKALVAAAFEATSGALKAISQESAAKAIFALAEFFLTKDPTKLKAAALYGKVAVAAGVGAVAAGVVARSAAAEGQVGASQGRPLPGATGANGRPGLGSSFTPTGSDRRAPLNVNISVAGFVGDEARLASEIGRVMREAVGDDVGFGLQANL